MQDVVIGGALRSVRIRRGWRQEDVANRVGVSRATLAALESGDLDSSPIKLLRAVGDVLGIRVDMAVRWHGGDLDRLVNAGHSALHESIAAFFASLGGWEAAPEVSFSIYGERGVIDVLAWHAATATLLVIELKTELVDVQELIGNVGRKRRLAAQIARDRGWIARTVATWVVISDDRTNQRRVAAHRAVLKAAFPHDGHRIRAWLRSPAGPVHGLSLWSSTAGASGTGPARRQPRRVRVRSTSIAGSNS